MLIVMTPLMYNAYDLELQKQEYDAQISLFKAGSQIAVIKGNAFLKKNTWLNTWLGLGYAVLAITYSFAASQVTEEYKEARKHDPKTYWQKVKKFWRA